MEYLIGTLDKSIAIRPLIENRLPAQIKSCRQIVLEETGEKNRIVLEMAGKEPLFLTCDILADIIIENLQIRYLMRELKNNYFYVPEADQCEILIRALKKIWYADQGGEYLDRIKKDVSNRIAVCMLESDTHELMLDGVIQFRMKDYRETWIQTLDRCVDAYILEHEQEEFIKLLRYFVSMRDPQKECVYIRLEENGEYSILDDAGRKIECSLPEMQMHMGVNITQEDVLLSRLISLSPETIVFLNEDEFDDPNVEELIRQVFVGRVRSSEFLS